MNQKKLLKNTIKKKPRQKKKTNQTLEDKVFVCTQAQLDIVLINVIKLNRFPLVIQFYGVKYMCPFEK